MREGLIPAQGAGTGYLPETLPGGVRSGGTKKARAGQDDVPPS